MATRILEKNGVDNTNIDGAGFNKLCTGGYDGVIKGILNECAVSKASTSSITIETGELLVNGFRIVLNEATQFTMGTIPSEITNYCVVAEVVVNSDSDVIFRLFIQPSTLPITQNSLFATESGQGTYQFELVSFDYSSNGIENLTTLFNLLSNDYKNYTNNKISELSAAINALLANKVGIDAQTFTEQQKMIARRNIGAISSEQSADNVRYVFIIGETPLAVDWLSLTAGGDALIPQTEVIYIIKSVGVYYNQQYIYNETTELYELTAQPSDANKQNVLQYSTMPDAATNSGKIVQFVGATDIYTNGYWYKSDGVNWVQTNTQGITDISGKADKVVGGTADNFAGLDANGNIKDSNYKASDFIASTEKFGKSISISGNILTLKDQNGTQLGNDVEIPSVDISEKEDKSNKTTTITASSTDIQYPSAKAVYTMVGNIDILLTALDSGEGV